MNVKAVAIDYDGTLTTGGRPDQRTLASIAMVRQSGRRAILVTGRILDELRAEFPDVGDHFDALVAENGSVLEIGGTPPKMLASPVPRELVSRLESRSISARTGAVLVAADAVADTTALREIRDLGLDCQLLHNRGALMILPAGVSKATGLKAALDVLGISRHNCVGIGDAENDHALLDACELGVAPDNAIASLKAHADITLAGHNGHAVADFLTSLADGGLEDFEPDHFRLELGRSPTGKPITIPTAGSRILIGGVSGAGKSYFAGLLAEQLMELDYSILVLDLEGDHAGLVTKANSQLLEGQTNPPPLAQLPAILRRQCAGAVVIDLSNVPEAQRRLYCIEALDIAVGVRRELGRPHWILIEEAHVMLRTTAGIEAFDSAGDGVCAVTYRWTELEPSVRDRFDTIIKLSPESPATLRIDGAPPELFVSGRRETLHVRHLRKYATERLPEGRRFYFRNASGLTGRVSGSLLDFRDDLESSSIETVRHHARNGEFSRWIREVLLDVRLGSMVQSFEARLATAVGPASNELKRQLVDIVSQRCQSPALTHR